MNFNIVNNIVFLSVAMVLSVAALEAVFITSSVVRLLKLIYSAYHNILPVFCPLDFFQIVFILGILFLQKHIILPLSSSI